MELYDTSQACSDGNNKRESSSTLVWLQQLAGLPQLDGILAHFATSMAERSGTQTHHAFRQQHWQTGAVSWCVQQHLQRPDKATCGELHKSGL